MFNCRIFQILFYGDYILNGNETAWSEDLSEKPKSGALSIFSDDTESGKIKSNEYILHSNR